MTRYSLLSVTALCVCGIAAGGARAEPQPLSDAALGGISAGQEKRDGDVVAAQFNTGPVTVLDAGTINNTETTVNVSRVPVPSPALGAGSGGAILGDDSSATVRSTGEVTLSGSAQQDIASVNAVNSAESVVGNGVNVWGARFAPQAASGLVPLVINGVTNVDQTNIILGDRKRSASLGSSSRSVANVDTSTSASASISGESMVKAGAASSSFPGVFGEGETSGRGAAGSGTADLTLDTGEIRFEPSLTTEAEGSLLSIGSFSLGKAKATVEVEAPLVVTLPELELDIDGSGCVVEGGECSASRTQTESMSTSSTISSAPVRQVSDARAEYIMGDNATLDVELVNRVTLSDNAQQNARAVNLVNAASSVVGNGVNVSATSGLGVGFGNSFSLNQTNAIGLGH